MPDTNHDSISCNSSDSDTEDNRQETLSPPAKRLQTNCSAQTRKRRKKSCHTYTASACLNLDLDQNVGSDSEGAISALESEEEKQAFIQHGRSHQSSRSDSPVLQIECMGSPELSASSSPDESSSFRIGDPEAEAEDDADCTVKDQRVCFQDLGSPYKDSGPEGGTLSISSCASSQLAGGSDGSPGQGGLRASEWVRQVRLETTPTRHTPATPPHQGDSGKKKKKFAKGGLAEQMSRILQREKSARYMWQHQHKADGASQGAGSKSMSVRVRGMETVYGLQLAKCSILQNSLSHQPLANPQCFVLFSPLTTKQRAFIQRGSTVHIYPPWQQVDTCAGKTLLCTRFHVSCHTSTSSEEGNKFIEDDSRDLINLSPSPVSGQGRWMCPCSTDICLTTARCPAQLFPFLPSSIAQHSPILQNRQVPRTGKMLHTVTSSDGTPRRTLTFSTLLESIEKAPAGDRLLPAFQATVLRIFREQQEADSNSWSLLVEDSQGTVGLITGARHLSDLEGRLCCFSCLRVHSRTNADRDPALFSTICGAWSHRIKRAASASQESGKVADSDDSQLTSQCMVHPPRFCYVLEVDSSACEMLSGEDWLTVSTSHPFTQPSSLLLTSLAHALQIQEHNSRVSVLSKFLYFSEKKPAEELPENHGGKSGAQNTSVLYVTDHTLQPDHPSVSHSKEVLSAQAQVLEGNRRLPAFVRVEVQQDCVTNGLGCESEGFQNKQPFWVMLRDVWLVDGSWIADKYTSLISNERDSQEVAVLKARIDPVVYQMVSQCHATLPAVSASSPVDSLASVSGTIQGVDEKSAYSWEECDGCGSDQLATRTGSGTLTCLRCRKPVSCPVQRMKMEVTVYIDADPSVTVTVRLQQSTIEELLPDEEKEEGYDVDCVLNKAVGPVHCLITSTSPCVTGTTMTAVQLPS